MASTLTKEAALHSWMGGFGLTAYTENLVPTDAVMPYLSYTPVFGAFDDGQMNIPVKLWYQTASNSVPNAKAAAIAAALGQTGALVEYANGYMMLFRGMPFSQPLGDPDDKTINARYINITVKYYSEY